MSYREDLEDVRLEEAAQWLQRLEAGVGSEDAFERWRSDPANALAYIRVTQAAQWIASNQSTLAAAMKPSASEKVLSRRAWMGGAAAASVCVVGAAFLIHGVMTDRAVARTEVGERTSLSLPDGGRIDVNTNSEAAWKFGGKARDVWLNQGEIALDVAADKRPFRLHVRDQMISLRAGRYNIRSDADTVSITVLSGQAAAVAGNTTSAAPSVFSAGSVAVLSASGVEVISVDDHVLEAVSAWQDDELVLDNVTLKQAVAEYNRYLKTKIVIGDPSLEEIRLGGRFATKDPAEFLNALRTSFGLRTSTDAAGATHITPRQPHG